MQLKMSVSDYYPHLTLTLNGRRQTVVIEGQSQRQFFVPLVVTENGNEKVTADPALSWAIAGLLPEKAPLRSTMFGVDVLITWAALAANSHDVVLATDGRDSTPPAFRNLFFQNPCGMIGHPYARYN